MRLILRATILATVVAASISLLPVAASATTGFHQSWTTSASYRASYDWVPGSGNLDIGGLGCPGGSARYWYSSLVKTSGSTLVFSTYSYPADGNVYYDPRDVSVATGTAYYMRWHGQNGSLQNGYSSPCQRVLANPS